jgi:hypothetical protein
MLKESDEQWLRANYPTLVQHGEAVTGALPFRASYNSETNQFVVLGDRAAEDQGAVVLAANFKIRIQERTDKSTSRLPALWSEGVEPTPDRHFNPKDSSACLCSPLEEREFLEPEFRFSLFLERLIIPFLYGQVFYSSHRRWPWTEYAHGATGVLEAYSKLHDESRATECLRQLAQASNWRGICSALQQDPYIKGHTPCFCEKADQIRRCHPDALEGTRSLQRDLRTLGIPIDQLGE